MIRTTLAYVGDFLGEYFFSEQFPDDYRKRVVYGSSDTYFKHLHENRLILPGLAYAMTGLVLPHGPSKPTRFRSEDNASGTKAFLYNAKRATIKCSLALYYQDQLQHFDYIQSFLELQHQAVVVVKYWGSDTESFEMESGVCMFDDATFSPVGRESDAQDSQGLLYKMETTFDVPTLFLETEQKKIIRCIKFEKYLKPIANTTGLYTIEHLKTDEIYNTAEYQEDLERRYPQVYGDDR